MGKFRFDSLFWREDLIVIDGVRYVLHEAFGSAPTLDPDSFWLFKGASLMEEYISVLQRHPDLDVRNLFELGIWESGSVAFWTQCFQPVKHVAIDLAAPREPANFRRFLKERGLTESIRTFWQTNQADSERLMDIMRKEFAGPLDLVIDDASHWLGPTKASFTTLFPSLREEGLYVVEDWGWHLVPEVRRSFAPTEPGLVPLINELLPFLQKEPSLFRDFDLRNGLLAIERGPMPELEAREFLAAKLSPQFGQGPSLIKRIIRSTVVWKMLRTSLKRFRR
jgi:hypothetical protein